MERGVQADLTREILSRLPVRSLVRFRIACREWNSIIEEPHFIAAHLDRSTSLPPAITIVGDSNETYNTIYLDNSKVQTPVSSKPLSMGSRMLPTSSINGILCIPHTSGHAELLNPATGESLITHTSLRFGNEFMYLGFRPDTMEYKIVALVQNLLSLTTQCEVYTVSSNSTGSWRRIQDFRYYPPHRINGSTCINGKLYWIGTDHNQIGVLLSPSLGISSLDLGMEEFSNIVIPNFDPYYNEPEPEVYLSVQGLFEIESKLCVVFHRHDDRSYYNKDKMHLYGVGDDGCLVEKYSFNLPLRLKGHLVKTLLIRNGNVYIQAYSETDELTILGMVNLESKTWSDICTLRCSSSFFPPHGESLVSLRNL